MATKTENKPPKMLSIQEVADALGVNRKSVEEMIKSGSLRAFDVSTRAMQRRKSYRISKQDVDTFLKNRTIRPAAA